MRLKPYPDREGKRVWLSDQELRALVGEVDGVRESIALLLAGRCGLRRSEVVEITPADVVEGPTGRHLRVWEDVAKKEHYREPPAPERVARYIEAVASEAGLDDDDPVVDVTGRTVYRWVRRAASAREQATGDVGWSYVDVHDLRRTWGTYILEQGVIPSVVMDWGGWDDWEDFRRHYLGEFSPGAIRRERGKVDFLDGPDVDDVDPVVQPGAMPPARSRGGD